MANEMKRYEVIATARLAGALGKFQRVTRIVEAPDAVAAIEVARAELYGAGWEHVHVTNCGVEVTL